MPRSLALEHILQPFGFDTSRPTKLVRHREQGVDVAALLREGHLEHYQTLQERPVFANCDQIVSFLGGVGNQAIFVGVYAVRGVQGPGAVVLPRDFPYPAMNVSSVYTYDLVRDERFDCLAERIVIDWGAGARSWYQRFRLGEKEVVEVLPRGYVKEFPGFLDFVLHFDELKDLIENPTANREWHRMLGSVSGVYLIVDAHTGMQYVGSAYGKDGIMGRWSHYVRTGHGGNAQLRALLAERPNARKDLRFSVLQALSPSLTDREVINFERLHKVKLGTRAHGLNSN